MTTSFVEWQARPKVNPSIISFGLLMCVFVSLSIVTKEREWDLTIDINTQAHMIQTIPFCQKRPLNKFFYSCGRINCGHTYEVAQQHILGFCD